MSPLNGLSLGNLHSFSFQVIRSFSPPSSMLIALHVKTFFARNVLMEDVSYSRKVIRTYLHAFTFL